MRAVVQRVSSASVTVDSQLVSSIGRGIMVLVGIGKGLLGLRVFSDNNGQMWKHSVKDIDGEVLCVSQFTLLANTTKNKPDFHRAMASESSRQLYSSFLERMRTLYKPEKIQDGRFGAMMSVSLTNEGPVTFTLDSRKFEYIDSGISTPKKTDGGSGGKGEKKVRSDEPTPAAA
ncbi:hypothetical protein NM688_g3962 [Phlebia brevispora]|uniref:Uncharacterized protein n=1 Tax=Phlebia brevispora TaxID=194682 RepID=A0ACC1T3Z6_9APHY|nr:hypothetical protein NM688_g3962 [Phlebia brevispora]